MPAMIEVESVVRMFGVTSLMEFLWSGAAAIGSTYRNDSAREGRCEAAPVAGWSAAKSGITCPRGTAFPGFADAQPGLQAMRFDREATPPYSSAPHRRP